MTPVVTSDKYAAKISIALCMVVLPVAELFLSVATASVDTLPTAKDINSLAEKAEQVADTFMQQSFKLRMQYEYSGEFLNPNDRDNLYELAKSASEHLQIITKNQQRIKQQIEDYQGDDWDDKYGSTGLWRKLSADIYTTKLTRFKIDYYLSLASEHPQRDQILHLILSEIDSLKLMRLPVASGLLKARMLALLAQTDPAYKSLAKKEFDSLMIRSDMRHSTALRISIERIKLLGPTEADDLDKLTETIAKSSCSDDMELVLSLAFVQRRFNGPEGFEEIVSLWPQTKDFLGSVVLSDLPHRIAQQQSLQQISTFEAELAVQAAWKNETKDYQMLLSRLADAEKFQTPLILYVTALAYADSSPVKAVNLLLKASKLQKQQNSDKLKIPAEEIARQAAHLAYNLFVQDQRHCQPVLEAFKNYCTIAAGKIDEELEYLYTVVLNDCGLTEKSKKLLEKIANRPVGNYRNKARLELAADSVRQRQYQTTDQKIKLLNQFNSLIIENKENYDCRYADEVMVLLQEIVDEVDQMEIRVKHFLQILQHHKKFAEFCYRCLDVPQKQQAALLLAEISVLVADKDKEKLSAVEKLLNNAAKDSDADDVDLFRCRARLFCEQGKFTEAAVLWAQICNVRKNQLPLPSRRSWKWWRAKFYELYCWSKSPQTEKKEVWHTIDVLENTFDYIPPLWAEKLSSLKQQAGIGLIDARN